jgi:Carboxypeptidase regulatory-like domain
MTHSIARNTAQLLGRFQTRRECNGSCHGPSGSEELSSQMLPGEAFTKSARAITICLCVALAIAASAQNQTTARIAGSVRDPQGAAIVRAEVVAKNTATGESRVTATDDSGACVLTSLSPGTCEVVMAAQDFPAPGSATS